MNERETEGATLYNFRQPTLAALSTREFVGGGAHPQKAGSAQIQGDNTDLKKQQLLYDPDQPHKHTAVAPIHGLSSNNMECLNQWCPHIECGTQPA